MAKDELKLKIYSKIQELNIAIDKDLFDYGYEILNQYILLLLFSIIISILLEIQKELILFYIFFVPLRKNMGVFHFENKKVCLIFSIIISIFSSKIIRAEIFVSEKWSLVFLLMLVNIFLLGCQSHPNKQLTKFENKKYKQKGLLLVVIYMCIGICCLDYNNFEIYNSIILNILINYISNFAMFIKNEFIFK